MLVIAKAISYSTELAISTAGFDPEDPVRCYQSTSAVQRELSLNGMAWPVSERRLTESSSHTNRLPNAGWSAIVAVGGRAPAFLNVSFTDALTKSISRPLTSRSCASALLSLE
jgi:hypothetical protein